MGSLRDFVSPIKFLYLQNIDTSFDIKNSLICYLFILFQDMKWYTNQNKYNIELCGNSQY